MRADYLAKIVASYKSTIDYTTIPKSRGKQILEDHYTELSNAIYINAEDTPNYLYTPFSTGNQQYP